MIRHGVSGVQKYDASGRLIQTLDDKGEPENANSEPTPTLTLDTSNHVFIDEYANQKHLIREYDSRGRELVSFDNGKEDGLHGITYSPNVRRLYLISTSHNKAPIIPWVRIVTLPSPALFPLLGAVTWLSSW